MHFCQLILLKNLIKSAAYLESRLVGGVWQNKHGFEGGGGEGARGGFLNSGGVPFGHPKWLIVKNKEYHRGVDYRSSLCLEPSDLVWVSWFGGLKQKCLFQFSRKGEFNFFRAAALICCCFTNILAKTSGDNIFVHFRENFLKDAKANIFLSTLGHTHRCSLNLASVL
jgi:hypothetical protein